MKSMEERGTCDRDAGNPERPDPDTSPRFDYRSKVDRLSFSDQTEMILSPVSQLSAVPFTPARV
jgi:hypothetical protein